MTAPGKMGSWMEHILFQLQNVLGGSTFCLWVEEMHTLSKDTQSWFNCNALNTSKQIKYKSQEMHWTPIKNPLFWLRGRFDYLYWFYAVQLKVDISNS